MTVNTLTFCLLTVNTPFVSEGYPAIAKVCLSTVNTLPSVSQQWTHSPFVSEGYPAIAKVCLDDSEHTHLLSCDSEHNHLLSYDSEHTYLLSVRLSCHCQSPSWRQWTHSPSVLWQWTHSSFVGEGYPAITKVHLSTMNTPLVLQQWTHSPSVLRQWTHSSFVGEGYPAITKVRLSTMNTPSSYDSEHTHLLSYNSEHTHLLLVRAFLPLPKFFLMTVNTLTFCLATVNTLIFCP